MDSGRFVPGRRACVARAARSRVELWATSATGAPEWLAEAPLSLVANIAALALPGREGDDESCDALFVAGDDTDGAAASTMEGDEEDARRWGFGMRRRRLVGHHPGTRVSERNAQS